MGVIRRPSKSVLWQSHFVCHLALNVALTVKIAHTSPVAFRYSESEQCCSDVFLLCVSLRRLFHAPGELIVPLVR